MIALVMLLHYYTACGFNYHEQPRINYQLRGILAKIERYTTTSPLCRYRNRKISGPKIDKAKSLEVYNKTITQAGEE